MIFSPGWSKGNVKVKTLNILSSFFVVVVWIEVTDGVGQRTVWLTVVKRAFEPMLSVMFKFCQYFKTLTPKEKKKPSKNVDNEILV